MSGYEPAFKDVYPYDLREGDAVPGYGLVEWVEVIDGWVYVDVTHGATYKWKLPAVRLSVVA